MRYYHCMFLDGYGNVYGIAQYGRLLGVELSEREQEGRFTLIPFPVKIVCVSAGYYHTLACGEDGSLWGWGSAGLIGIEKSDGFQKTPTIIEGAQNIVSVCAGNAESVALDHDGNVWSFGCDVKTPTRVTSLPQITMISLTSSHILALDSSGQVWVRGINAEGQLGLQGTETRTEFTLLPTAKKMKYVAAGDEHSLIVDVDGKVWSFGANPYHELGYPPTDEPSSPAVIPSLKNIVRVWAGYRASYARDKKGKTFVWGRNQFNGLAYRGPNCIDDHWSNEWYVPIPTENEELFGKEIYPGLKYMVAVGDGIARWYGSIPDWGTPESNKDIELLAPQGSRVKGARSKVAIPTESADPSYTDGGVVSSDTGSDSATPSKRSRVKTAFNKIFH